MKISSIKLFVIAMSIFVTVVACSSTGSQTTDSNSSTATVTTQPATTAAPAAEAPKKMTKEECLECHGPYEDIRAATAGYTTTDYGYNGDSVQPHVYFNLMAGNHDSTEPANCLDCHTQHADPAPTEPVKVSMGYCASCHHTGQLIACNECHEE